MEVYYKIKMVMTSTLLAGVRSDIKDYLESIFLYGGIGEDTTAATAGDTELGLEVLRKAIDSFDKSVADSVTASLRIAASEANNNAIAETGWFDTAAETVDDCDVADWSDSADMTTSVNTSEFKEGDKALNATKDAGAAAAAYTEKTTTSVDFTSKELSIWLYVKDSTALNKLATTNALSLRFGSDSSNYYQWDFDKATIG